MEQQGTGEGLELFQRTLSKYQRVALDTSTIIYFLESSPRYDPYCSYALREVEAGRLSAIVSVVVELELLVKPMHSNDWQAAQDIMEFLSGFPNLEVVPVTRAVAQRAAQLRAQSRMSVADAIVVATGVESSCDAVIGNDLKCARSVKDLPYLCLEDFVRG